MPELLLGDSLLLLGWLEDSSVDAVVTDPPYGLAFMGKKWDYQVPSVELWREVFRVLKPGGHVLSFGGTRTYHRMVVNVEDAGFEIRDQIQWLYGSGFPKSHDVSKGIDKAAGAEREIVGTKERPGGFDRGVLSNHNSGHLHTPDSGAITAPATDAAKQWQGWGTALKPANEPIVLARKPLQGTVAENVERFGTGGLNIDASRIGIEQIEKGRAGRGECESESLGKKLMGTDVKEFATGRWPANVLFDDEAAAVLDEQSGVLKSGSLAPGHKRGNGTGNSLTDGGGVIQKQYGNDAGGASRFFYVAKASKRERNAGLGDLPLREAGIKNDSGRGFSESDPNKKIMMQNHHPTVKPIKLMEYLVRLITPPGGTVLDPFMGSGTTGVACKNLGFQFVGIERDAAYLEIAKRRIEGTKCV